MKMRLWAAAALVALAGPAAAETAVVDGTKFRYAVPDGYCSLDLTQSGHRQLFEQTASKIAAVRAAVGCRSRPAVAVAVCPSPSPAARPAAASAG